MVRLKFRYSLVEIRYADSGQQGRHVTSEDVYRAVRQAVKESYGDYGLGALKDSLMVKYLNWETNIVIIRAKREMISMALTAITVVNKIAEHSCLLHTLYVGGTIISCQKFLVLHHRRQLPMLLKQCKMKEEVEQMESNVLETCVKMGQSSSTANIERSLTDLAGHT